MTRTPPRTTPRRRSPTLALCSVAAGIMAGCVTPPMGSVAVNDAEQKQLNEWGRAAFDQAEYERAAELFAESLSRAQLRDDDDAIRDAAFNLAASKGRLRQYADAREVLRRAHVAIVARPDDLNADCMLLDGYLAYRLGELEEARRITRLGLNRPGDLRSAFYLLEAYLGCAAGDAAAARASLGKAPIAPGDLRLIAERAWINAEIAMLEGRPAEGARDFDQAAGAYRRIGHYVGMAESLAAASRAYDAAGDQASAANRWLRAGRSAKLQAFPEADDWLRQAIEAARAVHDEALAAEAAAWLEPPPGK